MFSASYSLRREKSSLFSLRKGVFCIFLRKVRFQNLLKELALPVENQGNQDQNPKWEIDKEIFLQKQIEKNGQQGESQTNNSLLSVVNRQGEGAHQCFAHTVSEGSMERKYIKEGIGPGQEKENEGNAA